MPAYAKAQGADQESIHTAPVCDTGPKAQGMGSGGPIQPVVGPGTMVPLLCLCLRSPGDGVTVSCVLSKGTADLHARLSLLLQPQNGQDHGLVSASS